MRFPTSQAATAATASSSPSTATPCVSASAMSARGPGMPCARPLVARSGTREPRGGERKAAKPPEDSERQNAAFGAAGGGREITVGDLVPPFAGETLVDVAEEEREAGIPLGHAGRLPVDRLREL